MFDQQAYRGFVNNLVVATKELTTEAAKEALVRAAIVERDRVLHGRPKPSSYRQIVDGVEGASLESVRPDGVIVFAWHYLAEVVEATLAMLAQAAPVDSGNFLEQIAVFVDDQEVVRGAKSGLFALPDLGPDSVVKIVATTPYSRRLEVGKRKDGSKFVLRAEYRFVEKTTIAARSLYKELATFEYLMVDLQGAYQLARRSSTFRRAFVNGRWIQGSTQRRRGGQTETAVRYPAIIIRSRGA